MFQFVKVKDNVKSKLKKKDDVKSKLSFDHFEIFCKAKNLAEIGLKTGGDTFGQKWPIFVHKKKISTYAALGTSAGHTLAFGVLAAPAILF